MSETYNYDRFKFSLNEFHNFAVLAPKVTMRAPSFALEDLVTGNTVELKDLWKTDIALIEFGSFT